MLRSNKLIYLACLLLFTPLMLIGCGSQALPDEFDKAEVKEAAVLIVDLINAQDSDSLLDYSTPRLQAAIPEDVWQDVFAAIGEGGNFVAIDRLSVRGITERSSGEKFAVVTVRAQYEKQTFVFTISFTAQMMLAGLYYR